MDQARIDTKPLRKAHLLRPTKKVTRPQRVIFFDTETNQVKLGDNETLHTLKLGIAQLYSFSSASGMTFREEHRIQSVEGFWSWVDKNCWNGKTTHIVAHNIVFDLAVLGGFKSLADLGWKLESYYSKSMVSIFRWRKGRQRLEGLDNGNFFRGKLETWGSVVGLPKMDVDFTTVSEADLLTYCRRDVSIMVRLWETWLSFLDEHECGAFKPTVASTAFNAWRYRFMPSGVYIHNVRSVIELERRSYRGARTECLWVGSRDDGPFYYLDVNNMYGYIMQRYTFPSYLVGSSDNLDFYRLAYKLKRYDVIANVRIEVDEPWFPQTENGFTCYPLGTFDAVLTTPELKLCIRKGWLRGVGRTAWYRSLPMFSDYVQEFNQIRHNYEAQDLDGYAKICKLLVNSLYGKFGQKGFKQEIVGECDPGVMKREEVFDVEANRFFDQVYLGGRVYREWREGESYNSFPAICAHVTAYARLYLYGLIRLVADGHAYYMDTDSLIVDRRGYRSLKPYIKPQVLGSLKVEVKSPWLTIHAPKDYAMAGRSKIKGVRKGSQELEPGVFAHTQFMRLQGLIREGMTLGIRSKEGTKTQRREIHSGEVLETGWVLPFRFGLPQPVQSPILQLPASLP